MKQDIQNNISESALQFIEIDNFMMIKITQEKDEDKRKILHDDILNELGINQKMEYSWGKYHQIMMLEAM